MMLLVIALLPLEVVETGENTLSLLAQKVFAPHFEWLCMVLNDIIRLQDGGYE